MPLLYSPPFLLSVCSSLLPPSPCDFPSFLVLSFLVDLPGVTAEGVYGQQFGKLGLQRLIGLLQQFPKRDFVHHLVANMISNVATNRM
jgi:hypothetical protein